MDNPSLPSLSAMRSKRESLERISRREYRSLYFAHFQVMRGMMYGNSVLERPRSCAELIVSNMKAMANDVI